MMCMSLGLATTFSFPSSSQAKTYEWVLFDADDTLFSFDSYQGLKHMFSGYGVDFTKEDFDEYQKLNKSLWVELQNGKMTQKELQRRRFQNWADKLTSIRVSADASAPAISTDELNNAFLDSMAITSRPLEGAMNLLNALKGKVKLGIITNGFARLQQARLENLGLKDYFDILIISEEVGIAKPNRGIFDHALTKMGHPDRDRVLMVGDTLESDIQGGINAEVDTCWLNAHNKVSSEQIKPTYQVLSLKELESLLESLVMDKVNSESDHSQGVSLRPLSAGDLEKGLSPTSQSRCLNVTSRL